MFKWVAVSIHAPQRIDDLARKWPRMRAVGAVVLAAVIAVAAGVALLWLLPRLLTSDVKGSLSAAEELKARNDARTPLIAFALAIGTGGTLLFTWRSYLLSRRQHTTERYTRAVNQLGHEKVEVRCGGVYALERIARESDVDRAMVVFVFGALLRETRHRQPAGGMLDPDEDVLATLRAAARLAASLRERQPFTLDLRQAQLRGARLHKLDLRGAWLWEIDFVDAVLQEARFDDAQLIRARLDNADLTGARLADADLSGASLHGTTLAGADLRTARNLTRTQIAVAITDAATKLPDVLL